MSQWTPTDKQAWKERWERTRPVDPIARSKAHGIPHYNQVLHTVLMPQSAMPIGPHAGKIMERVPADYLAWVDAQPWAATWPHWGPVHDYLTRFPAETELTGADLHAPIIFLGPLQPMPNIPWNSAAILHTLPGHEDKLLTFASGVLTFLPEWLKRRSPMPHFLVSPHKFEVAIKHLAHLIDRRQLRDHADDWDTAHQHRPQFHRIRHDDRGGETICPCTKHGYVSKKEAQTVRSHRLPGTEYRKGQRYRHNKPHYLRAYHCPDCNLWHLTSQPPA